MISGTDYEVILPSLGWCGSRRKRFRYVPMIRSQVPHVVLIDFGLSTAFLGRPRWEGADTGMLTLPFVPEYFEGDLNCVNCLFAVQPASDSIEHRHKASHSVCPSLQMNCLQFAAGSPAIGKEFVALLATSRQKRGGWRHESYSGQYVISL